MKIYVSVGILWIPKTQWIPNEIIEISWIPNDSKDSNIVKRFQRKSMKIYESLEIHRLQWLQWCHKNLWNHWNPLKLNDYKASKYSKIHKKIKWSFGIIGIQKTLSMQQNPNEMLETIGILGIQTIPKIQNLQNAIHGSCGIYGITMMPQIPKITNEILETIGINWIPKVQTISDILTIPKKQWQLRNPLNSRNPKYSYDSIRNLTNHWNRKNSKIFIGFQMKSLKSLESLEFNNYKDSKYCKESN